MKSRLLLCAAAIGLFSTSAFAANYVLTIDGKTYEVDLGQASTVTLEDGKTVEVTIEKKDFLSFKTNNFSFDYPNHLTPSRTDLGDGIFQTMMATPLGTLVLVQEYEKMDPSNMVDIMLHELTKEEVQYGHQFEKTEETKTVNGKEFKGKKSVGTYNGEMVTRHVMTYAAKDSGLMVITMIDKEAPPVDAAMIEKFWETLGITME